MMERILNSLPDDLTPWQIAFWMVSPKPEIGGGRPMDALASEDDRVLLSAERAGRLPMG
ncbi:hypothetical protein [Salipiger mucosus]|uniref:Antitoxin Xre/MbcA/ParS-like toxin-binding domain-containing protein n=1 Tax=Salipiger mucosus DSM 16094 TaxID=1123237 RepID=S9QR14_9RHOB|nr:hypothetical protein [Salipiger mucosus]EPX83846.1 hypothetical protein Salmuc_01621 [Salipiger mucosus DSM 16094]